LNLQPARCFALIYISGTDLGPTRTASACVSAWLINLNKRLSIFSQHCRLFTNDLYQHPFTSVPVKFTIENLFPGPEVQFAFGNGDNHFAAHDLPFQMGIGVVLAGEVVAIIFSGRVGSKLFQPYLVIMEQAILGVIDEDAGGDVHGVDQAQALLHPAFDNQFLDRFGDVLKSAPARHFKPKLFGERFHDAYFALPDSFSNWAEAMKRTQTSPNFQPGHRLAGGVPASEMGKLAIVRQSAAGKGKL
jgi:hypothetical protein